MIKYILDGFSMILFFAAMYFLLIVGDVWENKIRCEHGYQPACQAYNIGK
ncbi:MAG: hypothetical protein IJ184_06665 [Alphaproteobacteria bacterium]|nr:hypothetical protein [Alphaproteobacteria bacterium]